MSDDKPETLEWNGVTLAWRAENWPSFDNRDTRHGDAFYAKVFPCGTKWVGEIVADLGQVVFKSRSLSPQGTPGLALQDALNRLRHEFLKAFPEKP